MTITRLSLRLVCAVAPTSLASSCSTPPVGPPTRPKLVVFLVVDGLPMRQVTGYREQLAPDGLARFLDRGTWFANARYGHAFTVTAAGHATMLSGAYPHRSGIIGNEWRDPDTGEPTYCTGDTSATYIGDATKPLDGTSPRNLRVDVKSKVIGISGKDRGAILPAGKTGTAYMYMSQSGAFTSTTFSMPRHPAWVDAFNAAKPADRYFKVDWTPTLAESAYAASLPDDQPWFGRRAGRLPMTMGAGDDKPAPPSTRACCAARSSTRCRSPSRARRSSASSSARTTAPTS